jgi:hypothetical protein
LKKRNGEFEIKKVESDLEAIEVRKDPPHGKSSTYRVDVALNPQKMKLGKITGFLEIVTNDRDFP